MINRRVLRVKAMQALYSYYIAEQSLVNVVKNDLIEKFAIDPAIHDFSEKRSFEERQKQIEKAFLKEYKHGKISEDTELEEDALEAIQTAIDQYFNKLDVEKRNIKKKMIADAESIYDWYLKLLLLPGEMAFQDLQEKEKSEKNQSKYPRQPKYPLQASKLISSINTDPNLIELTLKEKLDWKSENAQIRTWYKELVQKDEKYLDLVKSDSEDWAKDRDFLIHFFKQRFFKEEVASQYMVEQLLTWEDDAPILRNMVHKTLKSIDLDSEQSLDLRPLSTNKEDDFEFFAELFTGTINKDEQLSSWIDGKTKNWEVSRISQTDIILLKMAITEMILFHSIPVKVTINEYIEISKHYSTPKSKQFINGILDVLANELTSEGVVKKSGRGLIDNK